MFKNLLIFALLFWWLVNKPIETFQINRYEISTTYMCKRQENVKVDHSIIRLYLTLLSFEQLIPLDYFTLVFGGEVTSLGGELVGGETPWWRDDRIPL